MQLKSLKTRMHFPTYYADMVVDDQVRQGARASESMLYIKYVPIKCNLKMMFGDDTLDVSICD